MSDFITWSGWILAVLGVAGTIYYGKKSEFAKLRLQTVDWNEIHAAASFLAQKLSKPTPPAVFLATDSRGGIIARLIEERLASDAPILVGVSRDLFSDDNELPWTGFIRIDTNKWAYYLPESLENFKTVRIAIVDDATFTGETMFELKKHLNKLGFSDVVSVAILASEVSIKQRLAPDYFWSATMHAEMFFPWGRMR